MNITVSCSHCNRCQPAWRALPSIAVAEGIFFGMKLFEAAKLARPCVRFGSKLFLKLGMALEEVEEDAYKGRFKHKPLELLKKIHKGWDTPSIGSCLAVLRPLRVAPSPEDEEAFKNAPVLETYYRYFCLGMLDAIPKSHLAAVIVSLSPAETAYLTPLVKSLSK